MSTDEQNGSQTRSDMWCVLGILFIIGFIALMINRWAGGIILGLVLFLFIGMIAQDQQDKKDALGIKMIEAGESLRNSDGSPYHKQAFIESARAFYASHRDNGMVTIYDEQRIMNDLQQYMPQQPVNIDTYQDSRRYQDNRIYHDSRTLIQAEEVINEASKPTPSHIQRGIMKAITRSRDGMASIQEIMSIVPAANSDIQDVLTRLMQKGLIKVANRASGTIVYMLDEP